MKFPTKKIDTADKRPGNLEENILNFIAMNYSNPDLKLKNIALEVGKSEREVSGIINEKLNLTFKQYLNQIRILEAKRLLKETELSVKEIAYNVGYMPDHFRKVFNKLENCTPTDFKNNTPQNTEE